MEAQLDCLRARGYEVCAAERRQKVVRGRFVGQVDDRKSQTPLVTVTMEDVVIAHAGVKEVARFDARGIAVYVKRGTCDVD